MTIPVLDVRAGIEAENAARAEKVRAFLKEKGVYLVNLMASPGAGKTTLLCRLIDELKTGFSIGVMEADVDSDVDARAVSMHGAKAVQLHTGGMCHMDAKMTLEGLMAFGDGLPRLIFLENVGNMVCPAEFDTGAQLKLMLLSVPEGDDKPLKYPLMFQVSDILGVTKCDTMPAFDFDFDRLKHNLAVINPSLPVFPLCCKSGDGVEKLADEIRRRVCSIIPRTC
ncbi:MAG: hydrogenase nickel incorporation protein HypB [Clostridiales bacterium]|nr:hydrogenase nickel incorporation protein HypB [Clostridiales bacterium]